MHLSSTPVKFPRSAACDVPPSMVVLGESSSKRTAAFAFTVIEQGKVVSGLWASEKKKSSGKRVVV